MVFASGCGVTCVGELVEVAAPAVDLDEQLDQVHLRQRCRNLLTHSFGLAVVVTSKWSDNQPFVLDPDRAAVVQCLVERFDPGVQLITESLELFARGCRCACRVSLLEACAGLVVEQIVAWVRELSAALDPQVRST